MTWGQNGFGSVADEKGGAYQDLFSMWECHWRVIRSNLGFYSESRELGTLDLSFCQISKELSRMYFNALRITVEESWQL